MSVLTYLGRSVSLLAACLLLGACTGGTVQKESKRYFWPPGGSEPRIEYLNFFQVEQDIRRGSRSLTEEYFFGKERPEYVFRQPQGIVSDCRGRVFVSDIGKNRILVYDFNKKAVSTLKDSKGQDFTDKTWGLDADEQGRVYGTLNQRGEIVVFGADGRALNYFGKGTLSNPSGVAFDPLRKRVLVTDTKKHQLLAFSLDGELQQTVGARGNAPGEFSFPTDVDVDAEGNVFVLDSMNARVQVFDPDLRFLREFGERGTALGSFMLAKALAVSPAGHVYVTDALAHRVVIFDREGNYLLTFGGKYFVADKVAPGGFYLPAGIDADCNGGIWVADSMNRMFHQFQYLDARYLAEHPILPGQAAVPQSAVKAVEGE